MPIALTVPFLPTLRMRAPVKAAGRRIKCPGCGRSVQVAATAASNDQRLSVDERAASLFAEKSDGVSQPAISAAEAHDPYQWCPECGSYTTADGHCQKCRAIHSSGCPNCGVHNCPNGFCWNCGADFDVKTRRILSRPTRPLDPRPAALKPAPVPEPAAEVADGGWAMSGAELGFLMGGVLVAALVVLLVPGGSILVAIACGLFLVVLVAKRFKTLDEETAAIVMLGGIVVGVVAFVGFGIWAFVNNPQRGRDAAAIQERVREQQTRGHVEEFIRNAAPTANDREVQRGADSVMDELKRKR